MLSLGELTDNVVLVKLDFFYVFINSEAHYLCHKEYGFDTLNRWFNIGPVRLDRNGRISFLWCSTLI